MLFNALSRIYFGFQDFTVSQLRTAFVIALDGLFILGNVLTFKKRVGAVIPEGRPGHGGLWPQFEPPGKTDSRSPCPALNAMANHGILPHSGRGIPLSAVTEAVNRTYNFSTTYSYFVMNYVAEMLQKDYRRDTFDLGDLCVHNGIEHDASLTRSDAALQPDQSAPDRALVDALLASATGRDGRLTLGDLARFSALQRARSRATNSQATLSFAHKMFGSTNAATFLSVFGGRVDDLAVWLKEERIPQGWEPRIRSRNGVTLMGGNVTILYLEFSIPEPRGTGKIVLA